MKRYTKRIIYPLLVVSLLLVIIYTYISTKIYYVPSSSMEDSLINGDIIWSRKFFPESLQRGDILVFIRRGMNGTNYFIKRCTALPGDTLFIEHGIVYINSELENPKPMLKQHYKVTLSLDSHWRSKHDLYNLPNCGIQKTRDSCIFYVTTQQKHIDDIKNRISSFGKFECVSHPREWGNLFPWSTQIASSFDNFGPVIIPKRGMSISLTGKNIYWYRSIIESEMEEILISNDTVFINKIPSITYTFRKDYLFFMGDNRPESHDSRVFGFIPVEDVKAKANRIVFSLAKQEYSFKRRIDLGRCLKRVE